MGRPGARLTDAVPGPPPAVARTRLAVRRGLSSLAGEADPPGRGLTVLVAVSGGPDSLALAAATAFEAPRAGVRAGAVVVDHGLQPASDAVARAAADQCRALRLDPVEVVRVEVADGSGDGPEMAARTARHAALEEARVRLGADRVLLGHTRDDQAEQVLLGLLRGSGARSLAGMPEASPTLLRPFLDVTREETESACAAAGLAPWRDPHNEDPRFARVRARAVLAQLSEALGPQLGANLARTARLLRDDDDALTAWADRELAAARPAATGHVPDGDAALEIDGLVRLPRAVRTRALRRWLLDAGADGAALGSRHLAEVDRLVADWRGQGPVDVPALSVRRIGPTLAAHPHGRVEWARPKPRPADAADDVAGADADQE